MSQIIPTGVERFFGEDELIVSKTDLKGRITYVNDIFIKVSGFTERELIGMPHSLIRHPEMPRAVFKLLWETIQSGEEIFAYVMNMCKNGDHYWVFAHVTPTFDANGQIANYHSNRRVPDRDAIQRISALYKMLLAEEKKSSDARKGMEASYELLCRLLNDKGMKYEEFAFAV